ncbi:MAG: caspase family protein [Saprospiraceae bacterium]|nr:caspase family protein [Saprospiraceae bacterium]
MNKNCYRLRCFQLTVLACLVVADTAGQSLILPKEPLQQRFIGTAGQDELRTLAINWRGDIAAAGNTNRGSQGGEDIVFVAFDAQLNKIVERHIGRQNDDGCGQIAVLPDGRYVLAGYSTTPSSRHKTKARYFGKKDGWLLILDERGETEREILLGTPDDDAFVSVATSPNGDVWLAGNSGQSAWLLRLNPALEVVWERRLQYHRLPTLATAAALTPEGTFFAVGTAEEFGRQHLWVVGLDADGQQLMEKIYPTSQAEQGTAIAALDSNMFAIVGNVYDPRDRENGFLSILGHNGKMHLYQPLGGREFDATHAVLRLHNGQLLTAGGSASLERGSRRISAWLAQFDLESKHIKDHYYGSKLDDVLYALAEHPDGRLFAVGATARQVLKMRQGWLLQLLPRSERKAKPETLTVRTQPARYPSGQPYIVGGRAVVPFFIENNGNKGQGNLRAVIKSADPALDAYLRIPSTRSVLIPLVRAGTRLEWGLPVRVAENTPPGTYALRVQFYQEDRPLGEPHVVELHIGKRDGPILEIGAVPPDSGLVVGQERALMVEVRNTGAQAAQGLTLYPVSPVSGVVMPSEIKLGDLAPGKSLSVRVPVLPLHTAAISANPYRFHLRVVDGNLLHTATTELEVPLAAPVAVPDTSTGSPVVVVWMYPNPDNFDRAEIVWTQEEITVQVKIVSKQPITRQQFCLEINGEPCVTGTKFEEVRMSGNRGSRTFSQTVRLREGENLLRAVFKDPLEGVGSEPLRIVYAPAKPNLHIVAIGIPADDLKYTTKDARDFATALSQSPNNAFGKIFLDTLLTEERTTKTEILKALRRLQYRYADLQILPKDLLVLFVSGHGLGAYDGSFRLAASDYDGPFLQETSLDFEQEIVNYLQQLPCRKLFLVDACHSGTTSGSGLAGIASRRNNLNMLVSCQAEEYSYEDDAWRNGAFTRALVLGLDSFVAQPANLDKNRDMALDIGELFAFIQKEVPLMLEKKKPKPKTTQRPLLYLSTPASSVILLEKKQR